MRGTRACRFVGGPMDGWQGEYVNTGQEVSFFGDGAERGCYVYRLDKHTADHAMTVWRFDGKESTRLLRAAGLVNAGESGVA